MPTSPPRRDGLTTGFDLERFRTAQADGVFERALAELRAGDKRGHWMWFVFPQLRGLGRSPTAQRYAIASLPEARAYLADAVLGSRLHTACEALLALPDGTNAEAVLGGIDAMKLRSSATLFARAGGQPEMFEAILARFYGGRPDDATQRLLGESG